MNVGGACQFIILIGRGGEMESAMQSLVWVFNWWVWLVIDFFSREKIK